MKATEFDQGAFIDAISEPFRTGSDIDISSMLDALAMVCGRILALHPEDAVGDEVGRFVSTMLKELAAVQDLPNKPIAVKTLSN